MNGRGRSPRLADAKNNDPEGVEPTSGDMFDPFRVVVAFYCDPGALAPGYSYWTLLGSPEKTDYFATDARIDKKATPR